MMVLNLISFKKISLLILSIMFSYNIYAIEVTIRYDKVNSSGVLQVINTDGRSMITFQFSHEAILTLNDEDVGSAIEVTNCDDSSFVAWDIKSLNGIIYLERILDENSEWSENDKENNIYIIKDINEAPGIAPKSLDV